MQLNTGPQAMSNFSAQKLLEAFMAGTTDGYLVLDVHLQVVSYNQHYQLFHQQQVGELLTHGQAYAPVLEKGAPLHFLQQPIQQSLFGKVLKFTHKLKNKKGDTQWFDVEIHPLSNDKEEIIGAGVGIFDITAKHEAIEATKRSEELFKALVENSTDVFQLTNDELQVHYVSDSIKNVLGYDTQEIISSHFFNLVHPDDKVAISGWLHWLMNNPSITRILELRVKNKRGDWVFIEINGRNLLAVPHIASIVMNYRDVQAKKVADAALAMAEQRMSLLLNNTKESFIIVNSRLRIVTYNQAAQDHSPFFFTQELQSGMSLMELMPANEVEQIIRTFEQVFDGLEQERETTYTDKDGSLHVYNHAYRPLFSDKDIVGVFITSTNITERKKAEQNLRSSEERYKTIIQESFDAILIKDISSRVLEASPAVEKILGYTPEEMIGQDCFNYIHPDFQPKTREAVNYVLQQANNEASVDVLVKHKNGTYVWAEIKGKNLLHNKHINGLVVLLRNIAERKQAEDIISLSEQRFRGLVQSGADMISIIDEEGFVQYSSPTVKTILGNDPKSDIGKNVFDYVHKDDKPWVESMFMKMLQDGNRTLKFQPYRFPNSRGQYRWLETVATNLSDDPAIKGIVINSRDVTQTKKLNEEQQKLTNELIRNNKDLQQFSFITSHNLRAPVANLISLLSLFDRQNMAEPFNRVLIEKFEEATQQLNNTLNDLLDVLVLKSNTEIEKEQLSFTSILNQVRNNVESILQQQDGKLITDFSEIDYIEYNKIHLESIFQNLVSNAIKYASPDRPLLIQIASKENEEDIIVTIQDNGLGINLERYGDRLFGMYQRFHAGKEGKGLGLYMIKAQVEASGGRIEVESEIGVGTKFIVHFKK
jgi:PAS domain S-box-containing protein